MRCRVGRASRVGQLRRERRVRGVGCRKRTSRSRLLRSALAIVVLTWVPAALGVALHLSLFRAWGVASGYAGLSWALPASLVGLAAAREARDGGLPGQRALGVVAGVAAAIVLVIGAASVAGG